jgi:hypothetical protein
MNELLFCLPDIRFIRKMAAKMRIAVSNKTVLPEKIIAQAEEGSDGKHMAVEYCFHTWPREIKGVNESIGHMLKQIPEYRMRQDIQKVREDMIFCYFAYGFTPVEYFAFRLENKPRKERESFISDRVRIIYRCRMNNMIKADIFKDKIKTYKKYEKYYRREAIAISKEKDFSAFKDFVKRHPVFVKKEVFEAQGVSVELVDLTAGKISEKELFKSLIQKGKHILEEKIEQASELSAFNVSSVNTVRAVTFHTKHGIVVPYCTLRTGRPGSFVDNGGAGGIQACIDYETGNITTDGFDELGGAYVRHPSSGVGFRGYRMPEWDMLKGLVTEAALQDDATKFIGWDLAYTKEGWIIVEGNDCCQVIAKQMIEGRGMRDEFERIMADMDLVV